MVIFDFHLSGIASFDLYPNFEVRGREFKKIVNALK